MMRRYPRSFLSLAFFLAACSPAEVQQLHNPTLPDAGSVQPPIPRIADGFRSGTRIALLYAQDVPPPNAGRGFLPAQFPVALWDVVMQAPCHVQLMQDGRRRCVPEAAYPSGYYADNRCTQTLYSGGACAEPKQYVQDSVGCAAVIFRAQAVSPSAFYVQTGPSMCTTVAPPQGDLQWYARGDRIPDSDLAEVGLLVGRPG